MTQDSSNRALQTNRKACYKARDEYFRCMQENNEDEKKCRVLYKAFKDACPESWVGHFVRKQKYEFYKQKLDEEGMPATVDQQYEQSRSTKS